MSLHRDSVVEYAYSIPGLTNTDTLFAALHSSSDARAVERCESLISEFSNPASPRPRQSRMLRRLKTMIKLLAQQQE